MLPHPQSTPGARANLELLRVQQVALADYGVLNPDEFGGVATDPARGLLYVGTRGGALLALSMENGEVVWEQQLQGAVSSIPRLAEDGGLLLVGTDNGELLAIELDTRKTRWSYTTLGTVRNDPLVHDGTVYVVNSRDQVFALELASGAWRWQYEQPYPTEFTVHGHAGLAYLPPEAPNGAGAESSAAGNGGPAEAPNGATAGDSPNGATAGAAANGATADESPNGATTGGSPNGAAAGAATNGAASGEPAGGGETGGEPASEPAAEDGEAEPADPEADPWSGEEPDDAAMTGAGKPVAPDPADGLLFTGFSNGKIAAIGARSGEPLWVASAAPPAGGDFVDADGTPLILGDRGEVVVSGQSTGVYGLSLADGAERWFRPMRGAGTVVAGPRGLMLVASGLEGLYALEQGGRVRWRRQLNPGFVQAPLIVGDIAFLSHSDDGLLAFDVETGEYLAGLDTGSGVSGPPVYDADLGRFYTLSNRGMLVVFRTVGGNGP